MVERASLHQKLGVIEVFEIKQKKKINFEKKGFKIEELIFQKIINIFYKKEIKSCLCPRIHF